MKISLSSARVAYSQQKSGARKRGIEFKLTFEQWRDIWGDKLDERGPRSWQFGMCRINDEGAYEVGNVYLGTPARNGASRRMANENKSGKESKYARFTMASPREHYEDELTDEEYIERKMGLRSFSVFR